MSRKYVLANDLAMKILGAMDLATDGVTAVDIHLEAWRVAKLCITKLVHNDVGDFMAQEFRNYRIVEDEADTLDGSEETRL